MAKLIGTDEEEIFREASLLFDIYVAYKSTVSPFGDGTASIQIRENVRKFIAEK